MEQNALNYSNDEYCIDGYLKKQIKDFFLKICKENPEKRFISLEDGSYVSLSFKEALGKVLTEEEFNVFFKFFLQDKSIDKVKKESKKLIEEIFFTLDYIRIVVYLIALRVSDYYDFPRIPESLKAREEANDRIDGLFNINGSKINISEEEARLLLKLVQDQTWIGMKINELSEKEREVLKRLISKKLFLFRDNNEDSLYIRPSRNLPDRIIIEKEEEAYRIIKLSQDAFKVLNWLFSQIDEGGYLYNPRGIWRNKTGKSTTIVSVLEKEDLLISVMPKKNKWKFSNNIIVLAKRNDTFTGEIFPDNYQDILKGGNGHKG